MKQPHKHKDLIIAWANDTSLKIECNGHLNIWTDCDSPSWHEDVEYRIKPEVIRYRVALFDIGTCSCDSKEEMNDFEKLPSFKKWLTDWIEVEV